MGPHANDTTVYLAVLENQIGSDLLPIAAALHKASTVSWNQLGPLETPGSEYRFQFKAFCQRYLGGHQRVRTVPKEYFTLKVALEISALHRHVQSARHYLNKAAFKHIREAMGYDLSGSRMQRAKQDANEERFAAKPLSPHEIHRIEKAIYIFQLICRFLPLLKDRAFRKLRLSYMPFWRHFAPWEFFQSMWIAEELELVLPSEVRSVPYGYRGTTQPCLFRLSTLLKQIIKSDDEDDDSMVPDLAVEYKALQRYTVPEAGSRGVWDFPLRDTVLPKMPDAQRDDVYFLGVRELMRAYPGHDPAIACNFIRILDDRSLSSLGLWFGRSFGTSIFWDSDRWGNMRPFSVDQVELAMKGRALVFSRQSSWRPSMLWVGI
ncbi:hypothetical protein F4778DRAFT_799177 [Xylariomycetidae sp. FL2044]|nr:hypothetical protein F4778DRAFT_799177 [Xylariomycetidae sp. FL2044]